MSQIQMHPNPPVQNITMPQQAAPVHNPQANLPPEMQNARPAKGSIFARVAAFLVGAGAGGGTTIGLGGGALASSLIGAGATAALGGASVVAGIATGGAALIGGALGLGLVVGIKALVNHFRRAPDPAPRVQPQNQNHLPQAQPAADFSNTTVAKTLQGVGNADLPASLQQAADNAIARMRDIYGEAIAPQGASLPALMDGQEFQLAKEIRTLPDTVTAAKMEELVEKYLRRALPRTAVKNALAPYCQGDELNRLRTNVVKKHPELIENLSKANSLEEVQHLLADAADTFQATLQLHKQVEKHFAESTNQSLTAIAQALGLEVASIIPFVKTDEWDTKLHKLQNKIDLGTIEAKNMAQEFQKLTQTRAKGYVDAFAAVDAAPNLSAETKTALKMEILTSPDLPKAELFRKGLAAGQEVDASGLKAALDAGSSKNEILSILITLGMEVGTALRQQYSQEEWIALVNGNPAEVRATQGAAFMSMLDKVPGLKEALGQRQDLNILDEMEEIRFSQTSDVVKDGAILAKTGYMRVAELPPHLQDFATMQAQSQMLHTIQQADIAQELKTRWSAKVMNGEIANPAMSQALLTNVPQLAPEARPIMERFILMQSYAPPKAADSAQKAQGFAQEMAHWQNFNTATDLDMAPVANYIQQDMTASLYEAQEFDNRGISNQLKLDASRGNYTINGELCPSPILRQSSLPSDGPCPRYKRQSWSVPSSISAPSDPSALSACRWTSALRHHCPSKSRTAWPRWPRAMACSTASCTSTCPPTTKVEKRST